MYSKNQNNHNISLFRPVMSHDGVSNLRSTPNKNSNDPMTFTRSEFQPCIQYNSQGFKLEQHNRMYIFNSKFRKKLCSTLMASRETGQGIYEVDGRHPADMIDDACNTNIIHEKSCKYNNRVTGSTTNFEIVLDSPLRNVVKMIFKSIEFYNCFYTLNSHNNFFYLLKWHNTDYTDCTLYKIVAPIGNVVDKTNSSETMNAFLSGLTELNNEFKTHNEENLFNNYRNILPSKAQIGSTTMNVENDRTEILMDTPFQVLFSDVNVKFEDKEQLSSTEADSNLDKVINIYKDIKRRTRRQYNTLGYYLGFRKVEYICKTTYFGNPNEYKIISESVFEMNGSRNMYLEIIDDADKASHMNNIEVMVGNGQFKSDNVFVKIPLFSEKRTIQYDTESESIYRIRYYSKPATIRSFKVRLLDDHGNILDNNNTDFTFALEITTDPNLS